MKIGGLWIYPVKSLGAVPLPSARVEARGLAGDRRWMIVDGNGRFVTRRELPALARIAMSIGDGGYRLTAPEGEAVLPAAISDGTPMSVTVWRDTVDALVVNSGASCLISEVAGRSLRLAYMPDATRRAVNPAYAARGEHVSFADGFPLLVTSEASLASLNAMLPAPVPMARFRPNIVLAGDELEAWAEEQWHGIGVGALLLRFAKPCSRCIVITQNPATGEREEGNAVPLALRKLGKFSKEGALFGVNAIARGEGRIAVGDAVSAE